MPNSIKRLTNMDRIWRSMLWIYICSIWIWFALRVLFFDRIWWLSLLNTNALYLLIPTIILLPIAIYRFWHKLELSKFIVIGLTLPGLLFIYWYGYLLLHPAIKSKFITVGDRSSIDSSAPKFTAMTFNVLFNNKQYSKIVETIRAANPDFIGLQEVQSHHMEALQKSLTEYSYSIVHPLPKYHNIAFFSRFPIESVSILPASAIERGMSFVVNIHGKPLTVIVAHLTPNYVPPVPWQEYPQLLQQRYHSRAAEIDYLLKYIQQNRHPAIVLCDCNLTETSQAYPQMASGLADSFARVGWGLGHTFQGEQIQVPLQRLDYIWHTDRLKPIAANVGKDGGSDHLPLSASFVYAN